MLRLFFESFLTAKNAKI